MVCTIVKILSVKLPDHPYDIIWENDIKSLKIVIQKRLEKGRHFIITNTTIYSHYAPTLADLFGDCPVLIIDDGENYKNFSTINRLAEDLLKSGANRTSTLWAFGGGVIGDITGFLASIYMRGIPYFQIPTTLLSMVDSSVGGKTGVNLEHGKNMIGTFHQPSGVFIHVNFLKTLNDREFRSGLSEVIKSALLADPELFQYIENQTSDLLAHISQISENNILRLKPDSAKDMIINSDLLETISFKSVQVKANVVTQDEKENGLRAILNLGHTLAHALESFYNYSGLTHGEAVSIGLTYAALLSQKKGLLSEKDFSRIRNIFDNLHMSSKWAHLPGTDKKGIENLPLRPRADELIDLMKGDKKNTDTGIRFILLKGIGDFTMPLPIELPIIKQTLEEFICQ